MVSAFCDGDAPPIAACAISTLHSDPPLRVRACAGSKPTLSKFYMKMLAQDMVFKEHAIADLPRDVSDYMHVLYLARWGYMDHPAMVAAAVLDPEFYLRRWSTEGSSDELSEWAKFELTIEQLAKTPGAKEAGHTETAILTEYDTWLSAMRSGVVSADKIASAKTMPAWRWWRTFGRPWPHLRWFAMRLTAHGVSACSCERSWSAYEWIHNKKRNRLSVWRAEKLVRSFSNLNLLSRNAMYESGFVEWDTEMLIDEDDEDEPAQQVLRSTPPRSSERLAARPSALPSSRAPVQAVRVLSLATLTPAPLAAAARGRGRGRGGQGASSGGRAGAARAGTPVLAQVVVAPTGVGAAALPRASRTGAGAAARGTSAPPR